MRRCVLLVRFACVVALACAGVAMAADTPKLERRHLPGSTMIQGYPCAKGFAWFFAGGGLNRCTVDRDTPFGKIEVPKGSIIELRPDGRPSYTMLVEQRTLGGVLCAGGSWVGPAEGAMTMLYPTGELQSCFLVNDEQVQGVPCAHGGIWRATLGHDAPVIFYRDGRLKSCMLSQEFAGKHKWDRFEQPSGVQKEQAKRVF